MTDLHPRDHGEAVAHFRHAIIGLLLARDLSRGELAAAFRALAQQRHRPPSVDSTRTYSVPTLERWYYAFREGGMDGLRPQGRSDRGRGRDLGAELRTLLCDIRREHPDASVPLILRTLEADGRIERGKVSPSTVRKLLREQGLDRIALRDGRSPKTRLRWQAALPDALWQGDVCHGPTLTFAGKRTPIRVHGLLDDYSRYVVALEAHPTEREDDMLGLLVRAIRIHGKPDTLYLDNGSTYRGETLRTACSRLGIALLHTRVSTTSMRACARSSTASISTLRTQASSAAPPRPSTTSPIACLRASKKTPFAPPSPCASLAASDATPRSR